jgi:hypothetical protein
MGNAHTPADNIVYDLISIQYHALKGSQVYSEYLKDAEDHQDVQSFIERVQQEDARRAEEAHHLLGQLTSGSAGALRAG